MRKVAIDSLTLLYQGTVTGYVIEDVEGLDDPARRLASTDRAGEDGGVLGAALYSSRAVTISGAIVTTSTGDYDAKRAALALACRLQRDRYGQAVLNVFEVINNVGGVYQFHGAVKSLSIVPVNALVANFIITVFVPDPYLYSPFGFTTGQVGVPVGGGTHVPAVFPITLGSGSGGIAGTFNWGETDVWPLVTFRNALTIPYLYHVESDTVFALNYTLAAGDVVVVDMRAKTVVLNGFTSLLGYRTDQSDWFALPTGTNSFRFSSASSSDPGTVEVSALAGFLAVR